MTAPAPDRSPEEVAREIVRDNTGICVCDVAVVTPQEHVHDQAIWVKDGPGYTKYQCSCGEQWVADA